jgi:hypothetical protein
MPCGQNLEGSPKVAMLHASGLFLVALLLTSCYYPSLAEAVYVMLLRVTWQGKSVLDPRVQHVAPYANDKMTFVWDFRT